MAGSAGLAGRHRHAPHVGIAAKMFKTLADEQISIQMISTSEIRPVVIDEKYLELAVRVLHRAFKLDQEPTAAAPR
jgi:aspartate kinase